MYDTKTISFELLPQAFARLHEDAIQNVFTHIRKAEDGYRSQIIEENDENSDNNSINKETPPIFDDYLS